MRIVILRPVAMGDTLVAFPILRALREKYTNTHITLISIPIVLPLAKEWGLADDVHESSQFDWDELYAEDGIRSSNWLNLFQQTDLAIYLMRYSTDQLQQNLLAAGAREAIVYHLDNFPRNNTKHMVEYLAEPLGLESIKADRILPIKTKDTGLILFNPPIAIHPSSNDTGKRWPAASFSTIINRLLKAQRPVLLLSGPVDADQVRELRRHLSPRPDPELFTSLQNAPLLEVARRLKQCRCYLGNDTGVTHLAALLGVPTIALFRPHIMGLMHPLGPVVEVIQKEPMQRIPVDRVFASIQRYL